MQPTSLSQISDTVGINTPIRGLVLAEDAFAAELTSIIFSAYDTSLTREFEIVPCGGESHVISGLQALAKSVRVTCLGILDGDRREKLKQDTSVRISFLPGNLSPEEELLRSAARHTEWLASSFNKKPGDILTALSNCSNLEHQYQMGNLAHQLGVPRQVLTSHLVQAWLQEPNVRAQAESLINYVQRLR